LNTQVDILSFSSEYRYYGKMPECPGACCRDEGQGGGMGAPQKAFSLEGDPQQAAGFFNARF
jgi:hypothetical protein